MTAIVGNNGSIKVNGTVVAEVRNYSLDITADTIETSVMGTDARTYVKGMSSYSGSADVFWDPAHWTSISAMNPTAGAVGDGAITLAVFPEGETAGNDKLISGNIIITGYSVTGSMDGLIEASISFQGSGVLSYSATAG
jgi:predicted secreted protein